MTMLTCKTTGIIIKECEELSFLEYESEKVLIFRDGEFISPVSLSFAGCVPGNAFYWGHNYCFFLLLL